MRGALRFLNINLKLISLNCQRFFSSQSKRYACITGASSGIGMAYAERLALKDYQLFLI